MVINQEITAAGGTFTFDPSTWGDGSTILLYSSGSITLAAPVSINLSALPASGCRLIIACSVGVNTIDLNSNTFTINGKSFAQWEIDNNFLVWIGNTGGGNAYVDYLVDLYGNSNEGGLSGVIMLDDTIDLVKLTGLTSAQIILGNASDIPTATTVTGDVTISNTGVTAIGASKIVDSQINASAAIALSKLAALTPSKVAVTDGSGVITTANQVSATLGGTNIDTSASTGFPIVAAGTWSVAAQTQTLRCDISFVTAAQGTYYVRVPFPCTVTAAKARVTSTVSGTDDGTITLKDNGGTSMTGGLITIPASSAHGTGVAVTTTANNTFTANQEIQLLVAKTTSGGLCSVDITITRTTLS
jgi:hypothetical protein